MSTTQGPYTVEPLVSRLKLHQIVGPGLPLAEVATQENYLNFYWRTSDGPVSLTVRAAQLNAAYAEGQRSRQAELDKAVELLGKLAAIPLGVLDGLYADEILGARAYLATLNPQPDAAQ